MLKTPETKHQRTVEIILSDKSSVASSSSEEINPEPPLATKRVAAYTRVSTSQEIQLNSLEMQESYYEEYIKSNPEWHFVGVYSDRGISGTSYKNRDSFNQMIEDAKAGKIDLILTKSVSRFARNTVDSLKITRTLKSYGVEVYFEKENISSLDANAELVFTIMSSIAQEESRALSENVRWGKQRSIEAGKIYMPYSSFLGYKKGEDGSPEIVESEAKIVRLIYQLCLDGKSCLAIAKHLESEGVPSPSGNKHWYSSVVQSILTNEKYKGEALLQKTYVTDFLTKKVKVNHGEKPLYHIKDSHPAIIMPETFDKVQKIIKSRSRKRKNSSNLTTDTNSRQTKLG